MELAKLTSKGQITIPLQIRKKLRLKKGDKVFFAEEDGRIIFLNASQVALSNLQHEMTGEAVKAGFTSEVDVATYIKTLRRHSGEEM